MPVDPELGVNREKVLNLMDEQCQLVQTWINSGVALNAILYTLGLSFASFVGQCGAPPHKVERLITDILQWINSTESMREAMQPQHPAAQKAADRGTTH